MPVLLGLVLGLLYGVFFAGVASGFLPAFVASRPGLRERVVDSGRTRFFVVIALYMGILLWSLLGAGFGGVFLLAETVEPRDGLLSPNLAYTLSALLFTGIAGGAGTIFLWRRARVQTLLLTLIFAVLFGWVLPFFAT